MHRKVRMRSSRPNVGVLQINAQKGVHAVNAALCVTGHSYSSVAVFIHHRDAVPIHCCRKRVAQETLPQHKLQHFGVHHTAGPKVLTMVIDNGG